MRNDAVTQTTELEDKLLDLVAEEGMIDRALLSRDAKLADLDIASADFIMILMAIEEQYGVYISVDAEMADLKTVGDLLAVSAKKIEEKAAE
ncbi:MAG: phosphopantetheine-binding protein [Rhodobacter sp.]|nr:phosphopantetheine-binding protein [Rhodobacter sp.]